MSLHSIPHEVLTVLEDFQNARQDFAEGIATYLTKTVPEQENEVSELDAIKLGQSKAFELIKAGNASDLLKSLSLDPVPNVQIVALLSLAEMAKRDAEIARKCLAIVQNVVYWIESDSRSSEKSISPSEFRRVATHFLSCISRHSVEITKEAIDSGLLKAFLHMIQRFPPNEKMAGLWGIHYAIQHGKEVCSEVLDFPKLLQSVLLCAKEPYPEVSSIAISILGSFAKYDAQLAQNILDSGAVEIVAGIWKKMNRTITDGNSFDTSLIVSILYFLTHVIKHDEGTLSMISGQFSLFPLIGELFVTEADDYVRQNVLSCISVLAQYPKYISQIISSEQSHDIIPMLGTCLQHPMTQWQALRTLHSILGQGTESILKRFVENVEYLIAPLKPLLHPESRVNPTVRRSALRVVEMIGSRIGKQWNLFYPVAELGLLPSIIFLSNSELFSKEATAAAESYIPAVKDVNYLTFMFDVTVSEAISEITLKQMTICLRKEASQQKKFVSEGYLGIVQERLINPTTPEGIATKLKELRSIFSQDLLAFHTPNYESQLLSMIK